MASKLQIEGCAATSQWVSGGRSHALYGPDCTRSMQKVNVYGRRPSSPPTAAARRLALITCTACSARSPDRCFGNTSAELGC